MGMYLLKMINSFIFVPISVKLFWLVFRLCALLKIIRKGTYILNNIVDEDKTHYNFL